MRSGVAPSSSDQANRSVQPSARMMRYPTNETVASAMRCRSEKRRRFGAFYIAFGRSRIHRPHCTDRNNALTERTWGS